MTTKFRYANRRATATSWATSNPVLAQGEIGLILDATTFLTTGMKIGNGTSAFADLPLFGGTPDLSAYATITSVNSALTNYLTVSSATSTYLTLALAASAYATSASVTSALSGKQATLVSGTNIRTVNGSTLLGSTDLVITGGATSFVTLSDAATAALPTTNAPLQTALAGKASAMTRIPLTANHTFVASESGGVYDNTSGAAIVITVGDGHGAAFPAFFGVTHTGAGGITVVFTGTQTAVNNPGVSPAQYLLDTIALSAGLATKWIYEPEVSSGGGGGTTAIDGGSASSTYTGITPINGGTA